MVCVKHTCRCGMKHNSILRVDPTRTGLIVKRWHLEIARRFNRIKKLIWQSIVEHDALGLAEPMKTLGGEGSGNFGHAGRPGHQGGSAPSGENSDVMSLTDAKKEGFVTNEALPHKAFQFNRDPDKVKGFMDWLQDQVDKEILEVSYSKTGRKISGDAEWQKIYIDSAYRKSLADAGTKVGVANRKQVDRLGRTKGFVSPTERMVDSSFLAPVHADAAGMIYQRAFQDLRNVTEAMDTGISRSLSLGIAEGRNPRDIARDMLEDVEGIGINRARMIARTEVVYAYNEAALNVYEEAGLEGVKVEVEWSTAFHNVCPDCADLQGRVFTLDEAREVHPPLHPSCRCALIPAGVGEAEESRGQYDKEDTIGEQYKNKKGDFKLTGIFDDKASFDKPDREIR